MDNEDSYGEPRVGDQRPSLIDAGESWLNVVKLFHLLNRGPEIAAKHGGVFS